MRLSCSTPQAFASTYSIPTDDRCAQVGPGAHADVAAKSPAGWIPLQPVELAAGGTWLLLISLLCARSGRWLSGNSGVRFVQVAANY